MAVVNGKNIFLTGIKGEKGDSALTHNGVISGQFAVGGTIEDNIVNNYFNRTPIVGDVYNRILKNKSYDGAYCIAICEVTAVNTNKVTSLIKSIGNIEGNKGDTGPTGAKLVSQVLQGVDEKGGNIYLQTFDDGTTATFTAPKGDEVGPWIEVASGGTSEELEEGAVYEIYVDNKANWLAIYNGNGIDHTYTTCNKTYDYNYETNAEYDTGFAIFNYNYRLFPKSSTEKKWNLHIVKVKVNLLFDDKINGTQEVLYNQPFKYRRIR